MGLFQESPSGILKNLFVQGSYEFLVRLTEKKMERVHFFKISLLWGFGLGISIQVGDQLSVQNSPTYANFAQCVFISPKIRIRQASSVSRTTMVVKFIYSEKATKWCEIFPLLWDWNLDLIIGLAMNAISSPAVRSPWGIGLITL